MRLRGPTMALVWEQWRLVREAYFKAMSDATKVLIVLGLAISIDTTRTWQDSVERPADLRLYLLDRSFSAAIRFCGLSIRSCTRRRDATTGARASPLASGCCQ